MKYNDYQNFEEKTRQKERTRSRAGKDSTTVRTDLFSTSLERAFTRTNTTSLPELIALTKKNYSTPVTSLYLDITPERLIRDRKIYLSYFNSLRRESLKNEKEYINTLSHEKNMAIREDLDQIEQYLTNQFVPEDLKSLVIFKSATDLHLLIKLPVHMKDRLIIDNNPYTSPLEILLQNAPRILIASITKGRSRFYIEQLGHIRHIGEISSPVPKNRVDVSRPNKVERHVNDHLERHFKKTAEFVAQPALAGTWDCLLIVGDEHTTAQKFLTHLSNPIKSKLMSETRTINPLDQPGEQKALLSIAAEEAEKYRRQKEKEAAGMLAQAEGQQRTLNGLGQVLNAHNRQLIRRLFIAPNEAVKGYQCPDHQYISLKVEKCPMCSKKLQPVQDVLDELIERAHINNIQTFVFHDKPEDIKAFDSIAAITYEKT